MRDVLVIGGSRYFGKHVIEQLLAGGVRVTVVNRGSTAAPVGTTHLVADRDDEAALREALGSRSFDAVLDQVCYTPRQAGIAARVFAGRTGRYVMTSTIEVYDPLSSARLLPAPPGVPVTEDAIDLTSWPVDLDEPWDDPAFRDSAYGEGKRQAEAVFAGAAFPVASVRCGHVLGGGVADFTGRLAYYADRLRSGRPIEAPATAYASSFITDRQIADVLTWALKADFTGPVNAASAQFDVYELVAALAGDTAPRYTSGTSPYAFDRWYAMDTARLASLGMKLPDAAAWLPAIAAEAMAA
ncbi:NAD-dependent epimerase/dehydratase family protein [Hamadaea sp. NPDC050747]|uniref:NAD-dependent epimerase/dehydratase family protein n=1 Tax=Hamadaea sp. NPDC050747 TaxID=3155789 RepID=UPI0033F870EE